MTPLFIAAIVVLALICAGQWRRQQALSRESHIRSFPLPHGVFEKLRKRHPQLTQKDCQLVAQGLRQFFLAYLKGGRPAATKTSTRNDRHGCRCCSHWTASSASRTASATVRTAAESGARTRTTTVAVLSTAAAIFRAPTQTAAVPMAATEVAAAATNGDPASPRRRRQDRPGFEKKTGAEAPVEDSRPDQIVRRRANMPRRPSPVRNSA